MDTLNINDTHITWLNGGTTHTDGGAMFGPVPKPLWEKRYPANAKNQITLSNDPMLIQHKGRHILIDAGIGKGRLSDKLIRNHGLTEESYIPEDLKKLGLTEADMDVVLLTHLHYDHVTGLTRKEENTLSSVYPNATILVEKSEWDAMQAPSKRTSGTYWKENWLAIKDQVTCYEGYYHSGDGIELIKTSGHSDGHAIVKLTIGDTVLVHLADIFPTHAHSNPLWVTAFDDYPMRSIEEKEKWLGQGIEKEWIFLFYHDAYYRAIQFDKETKEITWCLKNTKYTT